MSRSAALVLLLVGACSGSEVAGPEATTPQAPAPNDGRAGAPSAGTSGGPGSAPPAPGAAAGARDWTLYPALADLPASPVVYALSDVHGGYDRLVTLLLRNGLLSRVPTSPTDAHWGAAGASLVVAGDLIDKGPASLGVIDLLMALEADAKAMGGHVVVTLGNHEAEFLVAPTNAKASSADGIDPELAAIGELPTTLASGGDARGAWLRRLPFGARVGSWFFAHAGDTGGRAFDVLASALRAAVMAHPSYDDPEIVGTSSLLESRAWYTSPATAPQAATALGVKHIVFGHDPSALGARGKIARGPGDVLVRIDCGMSPGVDDSTGKLLRITQSGTNDVVDELDAAGATRALFQSAR
jgi:hypothetical protein